MGGIHTCIYLFITVSWGGAAKIYIKTPTRKLENC